MRTDRADLNYASDEEGHPDAPGNRAASPDEAVRPDLLAAVDNVLAALEGVAKGFEQKDADERPESFGPGLHPMTQLIVNDLRAKGARLRDAALATLPAALDVGRLRQAIRNIRDQSPEDYLERGDDADAIAAEYARLTTPKEPSNV